jgi:hypothetical protein
LEPRWFERNEQQLQADKFVSAGTNGKRAEQFGKQCDKVLIDAIKTLIEDDRIYLRGTKISWFGTNLSSRRQKFAPTNEIQLAVNQISSSRIKSAATESNQQQPNQIGSSRIKSAAAE